MIRTHSYDVTVAWTGNRGSGTSGYREYGRDHEVTVSGAADGAGDAGRPQPIAGSSDSAFRGDPGRWNPEQLLTAALAQCHMLSYLHACAAAGIVVTEYTDEAHGTMTETTDGGGHFIEVVLRPRVTVASPEHGPEGGRAASGSPREVLHRQLGELPGQARTRRASGQHRRTARLTDQYHARPAPARPFGAGSGVPRAGLRP